LKYHQNLDTKEDNFFSFLTWKTNIICYIPFYRKIYLLTWILFATAPLNDEFD